MVNFKINDLVWAKMRGYSPWPGMITKPNTPAKSKPKTTHSYVYFFGTDNCAWIANECIEFHCKEALEKYSKKKNGPLFAKAVETIMNKSKHTPISVENTSAVEEKGKSKAANSNLQSKNYSKGKTVSRKSEGKSSPIKKILKVKVSSQRKLLKRHSDSSVEKRSNTSLIYDSNKNSTQDVQSSSYVTSFDFEESEGKNETSNNDLPSENNSTDKTARRKSKKTSIKEILNVSSQWKPAKKRTSSPNEKLPPKKRAHSLSAEMFDTSLKSSVNPISISNSTEFDGPSSPIHSEVSSKEDNFSSFQHSPSPPIDSHRMFGFLGLNEIGQAIVERLYRCGFSIIIWDPSQENCKNLVQKIKVKIASTPDEVVNAAEITFSCSSNSDIAEEFIFGKYNILNEFEEKKGKDKKGYVEMTSMHPKSSLPIGTEIRMKGGLFLEAPFFGSKTDALKGNLLIAAAGERQLYDNCKHVFEAISKKHTFVSAEVGTASKLILVYQMLVGTTYAAIAEVASVVDTSKPPGLHAIDVLEDDGYFNSSGIKAKLSAIVNRNYETDIPLKQMQQHFAMGLSLGDEVSQRTILFATANETYKQAIAKGFGDQDVSAVYEAIIKPDI